MPQQQTDAPPVVLTIAGLDPSGGAGIVADVKTFAAFGCYGTTAVTSLTFQNTVGVFGASHQPAEVVRAQVLPIIEDFRVAAWKTGMLPTREVIEEVARLARETALRDAPLVVDPVVRSTSGYDLIDDDALDALRRELLPLARIVTPNAPEAERITGLKVADAEGMLRAAESIRASGARAALVKGGHFDGPNAVDVLDERGEVSYFTSPRVRTTSTHGTGCTLAAAITACLARGLWLDDAVASAKRFVTVGLRRAHALGRGHGPITHDIRVEFTPTHVFIDGE